ncbi:MAG: ribonuclease HII [Candidatus Nealsonbacteria bacterium]|nr:ribonuclease HII [Candidatus Nealsonbacteria bacterium]
MQKILQEERKLWKKGFKRVVCLDESGRGPLAGPVLAAAVKSDFSLLKNFSKFDFVHIKDSKKLTPKKRKEFYKILTKHPNIEWGIGRVSEKVIDKINIKNAAELAMEKALRNLEKKIKKRADFLIIDGNQLKNYKLKTKKYKLIVKADEKVFSCMASGIIAKVTRDRIMQNYHKKYPCYGFNQHKGYPTKYHIKMLKKHGPSKIHRKTFGPLKRFF